MALAQIAERMNCSRNSVISINRRFNVREFDVKSAENSAKVKRVRIDNVKGGVQ
jgi:hypothetical protein